MGVGSLIYQLSATRGSGYLLKLGSETSDRKMAFRYCGCCKYPSFEFVQNQEGVKSGVVDVPGECGLKRCDSVNGVTQSLCRGQTGEVVWQSVVVDQSCNAGIGVTQQPACVAGYLAIRCYSALYGFGPLD